MTNRQCCRRLWPLRPGSRRRLPGRGYTIAKQFGFWFSWLYLVEPPGTPPASITNRKRPARWTRENYGSPLVCYPANSGSRNILLIRAFDALGNVTVTIIHFVDLLHTGEGFFQVPRSLVNQA